MASQNWDSLSDSGIELVKDELPEVMEVIEGLTAPAWPW